MLRPRERRRPQMPNQLPKMIEQRIVAFSIAHPGLGPKRVSSELAREKWGGIVVSPNGVWKVLCRHGLNTRAKPLGLIAGYAAPYQPPRDPGPEQHIDADRPGELVGIDCFYIGRLRGTDGAIWQLTAIDIYSSYAWAELVIEKATPPAPRTPAASPAGLPPSSRPPAGSSSASSATTATSSRAPSPRRPSSSAPPTPASTPVAHRPTATSKRCTRRSSTSAGAPRSPATSTRPSAASAASWTPTCATTTPTASTTAASPAAVSPKTSSTVPAKWSPDEPNLSAHLEVRPP
jgi:hypothetical protein